MLYVPKLTESEIVQAERDKRKALISKALIACISSEIKAGDLEEEFLLYCVAKDFDINLNECIDYHRDKPGIGDGDTAELVFNYLVDLSAAIKSVREKHKKIFAWGKKMEEVCKNGN